MKKLLLTFAAVAIVLSAASCKKVLAPSSINGEECANKVTLSGRVTYEYQSGEIPASNATVTITKDGTQKFTTQCDTYGNYVKVIPLKVGENSAALDIKGFFSNPYGTFEGQASTSIDKNKAGTKDVKCIQQ